MAAKTRERNANVCQCVSRKVESVGCELLVVRQEGMMSDVKVVEALEEEDEFNDMVVNFSPQ